MSPSAQLGGRRGRRRRRCRWVAGARARAARRGAAPCPATTLARDTHGTERTECGMLHTVLRRSRTGRRRAHPASPGASRACCMPASVYSPSAWWSTSLAQETRVSRRLHCGWWGRRSLSPDSRAVSCESSSAYSRSLAADGGPITRRTEDCLVVWRARRCRWQAVVAGAAAVASAPGPRSARPRAASTPPRATCPACPAARRTSACADTEPPHCTRHQFTRVRVWQSHCSRAGRSTARYSAAARSTAAAARARGRGRPALQPPSPWRPRAVRRPATCPSRAGPTASSSSAPPSSAPNPQAISVLAIPRFIRTTDDVTISRCGHRSCDTVTQTVLKFLSEFYIKLRNR